MGDLESNPELAVPGKHKMLITGTRRVFISCQLRDYRFTRLWGYKDKCICGTDEYGAATENKAVEENPSTKAKGFCDIFDEFGWTNSPAEDRWAILEEFFGDNCLPKDTGEQERLMELKRELERELKDPTCKVSCNSPCIRDTDHLFLELPKLEGKLVEYVNKMSVEAGICPSQGCNNESVRGDECENCSKALNPTDSNDPECKVFDDCSDAPIERVSVIECYTPDCLIDSADPSLSLSPHLTVSVVSWAPGDTIIFDPADLPPPDSQNQNRGLYVTVELRGVVLSRVTVNSTAVNVMPRRTFDMLGYNQNDLSSCPLTIKGFYGLYTSTRKPLGKVTANMKLGIVNSEVEFVVMDIPTSSYNLVLGSPWLCDLRSVESSLYQKVQLHFKMGNQGGILTIEGER